MAGPTAQFRPGRYLAVFLGLIVLMYALVLFTPGSKSPKLGIDLQGGTSITITARTQDGSAPSGDAMNQARSIMETRVNGSGVAGAQVQIQGNNQLVITVPGQNTDLGELTRPARLNMRPELANGFTGDLVTSTTATSTAAATGTVTGTSTGTVAPTTQLSTAPAIGDTPTPSATGAATPQAGNATTAAATSGQGLRAPAAATVAAGSSTPAATPSTVTNTATGTAGSSSASSAAGASSAPTTPSNAASSGGAATGGAATSGAATSGAATSGAATTPATATTSIAKIAGADPKIPTQPAGAEASWAAWQTAVQSALTAGSISCLEVDKYAGLDDPTKPLIACGSVGSVYASSVYLLDKTLVAGDQIDSAAAVINTNGAGYVINLSFKTDGFKTWSTYTTNNVGKNVDFTLDGEVISPTTIQTAITTPVTQISGNFTQSTATQLANALKFGALPLAFDTGTSTSVSAELGSQYLTAGLIAGGIGLALVVLYCLIYYRLLGLVTILSLVLSGAMVYAIMTLLGRWIDLSLDLAGIAGLIVAIGITADSFVIYFERLKDEVREGRTFRSAVPRGWQRAIRTILSADAISILSSVILYIVAVGDVKGFAFTLGLSTVLDLVIVFLVTHPLVAMASGSKAFQSARYSGLGAVARAGAEHRAATAQFLTKEA